MYFKYSSYNSIYITYWHVWYNLSIVGLIMHHTWQYVCISNCEFGSWRSCSTYISIWCSTLTTFNNDLLLQRFGFFVFLTFLLHASFEIFLFYFYWKLAIILFYFIFYNTHGLSFCFYLYIVKEENTFYFEECEKYLFLFCLVQFCCHNHNSKYV
jgi:hypothetical protein